MIYLYWIIIFIFLIINGGILFSDVKNKIIPNKLLLLLLCLLPFLYGYFIFSGITFNIWGFIIQNIVAIITSFVLYYFGIWSAGDAKYLLVLSLFFPQIGIIPFIWNIAIVTIVYLLLYCVYFYGKTIFSPKTAKRLFLAIRDEQSTYLKLFTHSSDGKKLQNNRIILKIVKQILFFLVFFVTLRLSRMDIMEFLQNTMSGFFDIKKYGSYFVFGSWAILFVTIYMYRRIFSFLREMILKIVKKIFAKKWKKIQDFISPDTFKIINICIVILLFWGVVLWDYSRNGIDVFHKIWLILTTYLAISLGMRAIFYGYKITFQFGEQDIIPIENLKTGDIIDKTYLIWLLGTQKVLGYGAEKWLFAPDPMKYFEWIENPIDVETRNVLIQAFDITNRYHIDNETPGFNRIKEIKILKTFAFWGYIFLGFLLTYFFQDQIIWSLLRFVGQYVQHIR